MAQNWAEGKLEVRAVIHRDAGKLEEWDDRNLTQFTEDMCKFLYLWWNKPMHQSRLERPRWAAGWRWGSRAPLEWYDTEGGVSKGTASRGCSPSLSRSENAAGAQCEVLHTIPVTLCCCRQCFLRLALGYSLISALLWTTALPRSKHSRPRYGALTHN